MNLKHVLNFIMQLHDELPFLKGAFPSEVYEDFGFFTNFDGTSKERMDC